MSKYLLKVGRGFTFLALREKIKSQEALQHFGIYVISAKIKFHLLIDEKPFMQFFDSSLT